ncbi:acyl-coenzyme A diphosphatase FITM2 isoform X1 [Brachionichthys hirsutus]|uniref:acyl-coenzyme A diphosphatase FITM2 isoform X1 n=1 Tax=Brachionichthys hirsutus TaxID=412623 RepID=UPI0036043B1F
MAALDVIVGTVVTLRARAARHYLHWVLLLVTAAGSAVKELDVFPPTYFSNSKTFLNVYFVKAAWGWTLLLLTPFLLLSNSSSGRSMSFLIQRLLSLVVATAIWYICTSTFLYIEGVTGSCFESRALGAINQEFTSMNGCKRAGFHWHGYDISGHSFILAYASLFIAEETEPMASLEMASLPARRRTLLQLLYVALHLMLLVWVWMFTCTSVYFHDPSHKLLGTACGLLGWYLTYRVWYLKPLSPGLPPQLRLKAQED